MTNFAFEKFRAEYKKNEFVEFADIDIENNKAKTTYREHIVNVTNDSCECWFLSTMELPCRHIFKLLAELGQNSNVLELCARRWTRDYYNKSHPVFNLNDPSSARKTSTYVQKFKIPAEVDKYKKNVRR